jgi:alpha-tubulin suppressor-like RCC1 family protein
MNIVLYSNELDKYYDDVTNCINDKTILVKYDFFNDTFSDILHRLSNLQLNDTNIPNIAIFQQSNLELPLYNFIDQHDHIVSDISENDPYLESWTSFIEFISELKSQFNVINLDLLMCKIYSDIDWKHITKIIEERTKVNIRSSDDNTGHVLFDGDWILESEGVDIDLINLYFNENIKDVNIILDMLNDSYNMIVADDGKIYFTGRNQGQMGSGDTVNSSNYSASDTPDDFEADEQFLLVASTGRTYSTMAYTNYGNIYITGDHTYGVGGDKYSWSKFDSNNTQYNNVGDVTFLEGRTIKALIGTNTLTFLALLDNGDLYGYGRNQYGECLTGNTSTQSQFVKLDITNDEKIIKVSAHCYGAVIALTENHNVYTWGNNQYGRLALGNTNSPKKSLQTPTISIDDDYVIDVTSGTMILTNNGRVFAAGREYKYQFQRNTSSSSTVNRKSFVEISLDSLNGTETVTTLCVTKETILLGTDEGNIYAAGVDHNYTATNKLTNNGGLKICLFESGHSLDGNIVHIGSLNDSIYFITDTGYKYVSGDNNFGQSSIDSTVYKWNKAEYTNNTYVTNAVSTMNQSYLITIVNEMSYDLSFNIIQDNNGNNVLDIFNGSDSYQDLNTELTLGVYQITDISDSLPLALLNHGENNLKYDGTNKVYSNVQGPDGNYYDFYSGTLYIYVDGSFNDGKSFYTVDASYGYLGTEGKIFYNGGLEQYATQLDSTTTNEMENSDFEEYEILLTYDASGGIVCDLSNSGSLLYFNKTNTYSSNGVYIFQFNYPRYFIRFDASDSSHDSDFIFTGLEDASSVTMNNKTYYNGSVSMLIQCDASFDVYIEGYDTLSDTIVDMGYILTIDTTTSMDSFSDSTSGLNTNYISENNFVDFLYQPFDYTIDGNDAYYTASAELVYSGIKTHSSAGEIIYEGHYSTQTKSGHNAGTLNIVIVEDSANWRLSSDNDGTFLINSSGVFSATTTNRTYDAWSSLQPYFMEIGPIGNINSRIFQRDNLPEFNENYNIGWFSTNGTTDVFSHHFAFSHDYPLTSTSLLFPVHYIWNGNNHDIAKLSFMTFFSSTSSNDIDSTSGRHYLWNEMMNDITFQYGTDIYMYALQFTSFEENSKQTQIPFYITESRFVEYNTQQIIDFNSEFEGASYSYDQTDTYGIEKGIMYEINTPTLYEINQIIVNGTGIDVSFEYVSTNTFIFKINDYSDNNIPYFQDISSGNAFNTFGKLICQNSELINVDVSNTYDISLSPTIPKSFHYYEEISGTETWLIPYELTDSYEISNNTVYSNTRLLVEAQTTYSINSVPSWYPIAIKTGSENGLISIEGSVNNKLTSQIDGVTYDFYYGDVEIVVSSSYNYTDLSYSATLFSSFNDGIDIASILIDASSASVVDSSDNVATENTYTNLNIDTSGNVVMTFDKNSVNVSMDLSLALVDICDNYYGVLPSSTSLYNLKSWNHMFYFKLPASNSDMSFAIDYTNMPYFDYSDFQLSGSDLHDNYESTPEIKYQLFLDLIKYKFGSLYAVSLIQNKDDIISQIQSFDSNMNNNLVNLLKSSFGIMNDTSYNTSESMMTSMFSIINQSSTRKQSFEEHVETYLNRMGSHEDVWIPLNFVESDKLVFKFSYNASNTDFNKKYMFCLDLYDDPSQNEYIYLDLSSNTSIDVSNDNIIFNNDFENTSIKRYYVSEGTYTFTDICQNYPIAFLNHGKDELVSYSGDISNADYHTVNGDEEEYTFYHGTIELTVHKPFDVLSLICYHNSAIYDVGGSLKIQFNNSS